jgi:hypothetical protein
MTDTTMDHRHVDWAIEEFDRALADLLEAERRHPAWTTTLALADRVIATRLEAHTQLIRAGWQPPPRVARDLARDRLILELAVCR